MAQPTAAPWPLSLCAVSELDACWRYESKKNATFCDYNKCKGAPTVSFPLCPKLCAADENCQELIGSDVKGSQCRLSNESNLYACGAGSTRVEQHKNACDQARRGYAGKTCDTSGDSPNPSCDDNKTCYIVSPGCCIDGSLERCNSPPAPAKYCLGINELGNICSPNGTVIHDDTAISKLTKCDEWDECGDGKLCKPLENSICNQIIKSQEWELCVPGNSMATDCSPYEDCCPDNLKADSGYDQKQ